MLYNVKLSEDELSLLASFIGRPIDRVCTDDWAAEFQSGRTVISVVPEEVATPDDEHPLADVDRPLVRLDTDTQRPKMPRLLANHLGTVRTVNVISTFECLLLI